jgi:hypothetical protein
MLARFGALWPSELAILHGWTEERASAMLQGAMSAEDAKSLETLRGLSDINCEEGKKVIDDLEPWHGLVAGIRKVLLDRMLAHVGNSHYLVWIRMFC